MAETRLRLTQTNRDAGGQRLMGLAEPTQATDATTKQYVDAAAIGIDWKQSVRVATTTNGALTTAYAAGSVVDGVTLATNDRILIKDQTTGSQNGIYIVNVTGSPTRASDADTNAEINPGMAVFIEEGTQNADTGWLLTTDNPITLGTTSLVFTQFTGVGTLIAGAGLVKTGNTIDVQAGSNKIQVNADNIDVNESNLTLGNLGGTLPISKGGTGQTTAQAALDALLPNQTGQANKFLTSNGTTGAWGTPPVFTRRTLTGAVDSSNTVFTLGVTPNPVGSEMISQNGIVLNPGAGNDYSVSGATITFATAPTTGDVLQAFASA